MNTQTRHFLLNITLAFVVVWSQFACAQGTSSPAPLRISDVPRNTQFGSSPAPAGAPGNGRYVPPVPANPSLPTLWLIGDSTVRNGTSGDNGPNGQWGWGAPLTAFFDLKKVNLVNRAFGGTSSRSFYTGFWWQNLKPLIKKGDFVMMQFGHNDGGRPEGVYPYGRASLKGIGDETREVETTPGTKEVVHTFGWYLKQFVAETRAQGATPIICSLTPRKRWSEDGKFQGGGDSANWAEQVAKETNTLFVPLNAIASQTYEKLGREKVDTLFVPSPKESLHTGWDGAVVNAECVISGLKALLNNPLATFFSARANEIAPASGITTALNPPLTSVSAKDAPMGTDVKLEDKGDQAILSNGIITAVVEKSAASISSLQFNGAEMALPGKNIYFSMDGGKNYRSPSRCIFSVKTQTPDMVDISCKQIWKNEPQAFDIDVHYILRRGDSGVYVYAVLDHPERYPETTYGEWRMVWRTPAENEDWICVDEQRHWQMPNLEDYKTAQKTAIGEIVKLTQGPRAGQYDCKYDFNASYYDIGCWGHAFANSKRGAWIVLGGFDYFNDGPTKQDLNAAAGINHIHFGMNHYNSSSPHLAAGEKWSKMYGPYLLYCNANEGGVEALWKDAKARVEKEKAAWPYAWLTGEPHYPPAAERGSVSGRIVLKDALKPQLTFANAWVGVAQPDSGGNWQFESKRYQYWTRADASGAFTIPHVRPGDYTLYAFTDGVVGEFSKANIRVGAGQKTDAAELVWHVSHKGRAIAWEIGVPDRTAKEFRHGNDYFHGYVWENFPKEFPNPLEYTIGQSKPATDWNYAQSGYGEVGKLAPWKWRIHFKLNSVPPTGDATLTLAIASADRAHIDVYVNDENTPVTTVTPTVQGGNALLRESIHAKYCVEQATIPTNKLRAGDNTITLVQSSVKSPGYHVMYDYLSLDLP